MKRNSPAPVSAGRICETGTSKPPRCDTLERTPSLLYGHVKRSLDIAVALFGIVLLAPVIAVSAIAVRLSMGKPIIYRQERAGKHGVTFNVIKLRTMREASEETGAGDANRITKVGAFLRSTSVDELPSLVNIIRGEMSLVGPRPLPIAYNRIYKPRHQGRMAVSPGLTGLAQVSGRNALPWVKRLELDIHYVNNRSMKLDLSILARTVIAVISRDGINELGQSTSSPLTVGYDLRRGASFQQDKVDPSTMLPGPKICESIPRSRNSKTPDPNE